jgi:hypothetical protein
MIADAPVGADWERMDLSTDRVNRRPGVVLGQEGLGVKGGETHRSVPSRNDQAAGSGFHPRTGTVCEAAVNLSLTIHAQTFLTITGPGAAA